MDSLVSMITGASLEETIARIVIFLAIGEFIGAIFGIIGNMKGK